jgi:hypothetical protein
MRAKVTIGNLATRGSWVLHCDGEEIARGKGGSVEPASTIHVRSESEGIRLQLGNGKPCAFKMVFELDDRS